jgi:pimeloyl-ACP methyl ester carboxylesterase
MSSKLAVAVTRDGRTREVDVFVDDAAGTAPDVLLMHGFARGPSVLDEFTAALVAAGSRVVRPHIRSFGRRRGMTDPDFLGAAARAAMAQVDPTRPTVVIGHSAGGACAAHVAAELHRAGHPVLGVVLVDPNESLTPMLVPGVEYLGRLGAEAIRVAAAEPGRCNRKGLGPQTVASLAPGFVGVRIVGGTHCEIEGTAADLVCKAACGGASDPERTSMLHALLVGWVAGLGVGDSRFLPSDQALLELVEEGKVVLLPGASGGPTIAHADR